MKLKNLVKYTTNKPGVYLMRNQAGDIVYIGKAKNLRKRLLSYFQKANDLKSKIIQKEVKDIDVTVTLSELDAILLENNLIKRFKPKYNIQLKDDKGYPYIACSKKHDFPRIYFYRKTRAKHKDLLFGPYLNTSYIHTVLDYIYKTFKIRQCNDSYFRNRSRPCLQYQISRCSAPCVDYIGQEDYKKNVQLATMFLKGKNKEMLGNIKKQMQLASRKKEYERAAYLRDLTTKIQTLNQKQIVVESKGDRDILAIVEQNAFVCVQLLNIRNGSIISSRSIFLNNELNRTTHDVFSEFILQYYLSVSDQNNIPGEIVLNLDLVDRTAIEKYLKKLKSKKVILTKPKKGKKVEFLTMAMNSAEEACSKKALTSNFFEVCFELLGKLLKMKTLLKKIECFDISHMSGEATVGSCVVFTKQGSAKKLYRQYSVDIGKVDDYKSLAYVMSKRFAKPKLKKADLPELLIIDGGLGQLSIVSKELEKIGGNVSKIKVIGIAKGRSRKPGLEKIFYNNQLVSIDSQSDTFKLIQIIRDEAHRFAITNQRKKLRKEKQRSILESINGLGPNKRRLIIKHFGGLQGLKEAKIDQLIKIRGIGQKLAKKIYTLLNS